MWRMCGAVVIGGAKWGQHRDFVISRFLGSLKSRLMRLIVSKGDFMNLVFSNNPNTFQGLILGITKLNVDTAGPTSGGW
jgi:hypothetical protein